jgi:protein-L-isoaspartate O-methyltransferase
VTGLDISKTFVGLARKNAEKSGVHVRFEQGNASRMPFSDQSFDFLVCRAAFKNFADPIGARKARPVRRSIASLRGSSQRLETTTKIKAVIVP